MIGTGEWALAGDDRSGGKCSPMFDVRGTDRVARTRYCPCAYLRDLSSSACLATSELSTAVRHAARLGHQSVEVGQATGVEAQWRRNRQNNSEAVALTVSKNAPRSRVLSRSVRLESTGRMKFSASRSEPNPWTSVV
jgi:hypothetical protein